ncbi:ATP-binding cassette sub-family C member 4-like [Schistocerca piceifrons]|uniref:ATP-binding cassette sub-family C member 4-like n=1 Tax=Schistocerca piceifrons TaxID=274613 RepID=UPI001F5FA003|nr:ATP-binding cassette sub-family C member 4-like [Schistocerca piceifrons]
MDAGKKRTRHNPRKTANPLSVLFFSYTLPLFREGYSRDLTVDDLFEPLDEDTSALLGDQLEQQWEKQLKKKKPSLIGAIVRTFGLEYFRMGCLIFLYDIVLRMLQPLMLGYLLQYFTPPRTMPREEAVLYAAAIVVITALSTVSFNHYMLGALRTGMRMRTSCCSLIYRKSLRLSRTALGETAAGQVVNLLSNDVSRFDLVSVFMHSMWCAPVTGCICAYFIYSMIGASAFVGIGLVFVIVPTQAYLGKLSSKYRSQTALKTDKRVRLTDEIISGMQVIKMYAWEKPFAKLIELARKLELKVIIKTSYIRGIFMSFNLCTTRVALCCSLITFVLTGNDLTADKVFVVLTYFNVLAQTMSMVFVRGIAELAEVLVSVRRIEEFLANEEIAETETKSRVLLNGVEHKEGKEEKVDDVAVQLEGVTAKWVESLSDNTLDAVDLRVHRGQLVGVAGPVGAGKSSLLQAILGELTVSEGTCKALGRLSYACQDPWVFAATVRQNILFGLPFDRRRYREVIRVCALQRDLDLLPQGDLTVVGERGTSLSGGQKARVNLARAVYRDADIYLLDDPLSAVDTHVGKHLFEECIVKFLHNKTRILVTHQIQNLPHTDHVVLIDAGKVKIQGLYASVVQNPDYAMMLSLSGKNTDEDESEENKSSQTFGRQLSRFSRQISRASTRSASSYHGSLIEEEEDEEAPDMMEATTKGVVKKSPYVGYFRSGTNYFVIFMIILLFALAQTLASGSDYFISYWTTQEETRMMYMQKLNSLLDTNSSAVYDELLTENNMTSQGNKTFNVMEFVTTNNETNQDSLLSGLYETETLIYMYVAIIVGLLVIAFTRSLTFYNICIKASRKLHDTMFTNLMRAPMRFFNTNPSGRILNRFSKDMGAIDEILPKAILDATQIIMTVCGSLIIAVVINWVYLIPIIVMGLLFWFMRKIYLRSSMNIKRLEGMTKSPVFTHLLATLQGLTTIRAYGAESILREEFDKHQDLHTSAWYMFLTTSQTFGFTLDIMSTIYMAFISFSFLFLEDLFSGQVGLAITQAMSLTGMIQFGMRQSAEVANQMMSVERVMEYLGLEEEPLLETPPEQKTPKDWPSKGEIEFRHIYMRYGPQTDPVIIDLNLRIKHGEKVGVVGRTGAGKSSLISALFRLAFLEGELMIDGLDTAKVGLRDLRARLSIIPQDPVLFAGTLRFNLDPFDEFSDEVLWRTLDEVELRESLHDSLGLQTRVLDQGSNFSVGQRQLVCLARAILRDNRILMLDEATANVDNNTDSLIQKTIRLKFAHCTVLTVAHRLNTIMDSDKVLVMDAGRMVEFDHPHLLLQNKEGYFYKMVQQTGPSMAEQLRRVAEECYHGTIRL